MAVCVCECERGARAIRSVFSPRLANITLGGARTPLVGARAGGALIGPRLFIVLIEDALPLVAFCETSREFCVARLYENTSVRARRVLVVSGVCLP